MGVQAPAESDLPALGTTPMPTAYFGDLHVHTRYSFDAYVFGTVLSPDDAYEFAKGRTVRHPRGFDMRLDRPLDFYAVTDHAKHLGVWSAWGDPDHPDRSDPDVAACADAETRIERQAARWRCVPLLIEKGRPQDTLSAWTAIRKAAARHNDPGVFTTFVGYEYTGMAPANLHRNVIYKDDRAPDRPFSTFDSKNPEDLWAWMDAHRAQGIDAIAIPHNSNVSDGGMFDKATFGGGELTAEYASTRMRNEPLVEITQVKGTSDTHPFLSPHDEWADFEINPYLLSQWNESKPQGSYLRKAWLDGIAMGASDGFNPYRFGIVGGSDTHNGATRYDEDEFVGKFGLMDSTGELRGSTPLGDGGYRESYYRYWSASGLTGVWAIENTRGAIFDALRRKETFATSGPRIQVRLIAAYGLGGADVDDPAIVDRASATGVPQGGRLAATSDAAPNLLAWALADPQGGRLQRLQIIKGWTASDGSPREAVYDVACSDGGIVDADTHRCPDSGAIVDLSTCAVSRDIGAMELKTLWRDPHHDATSSAFYYVRALENPSCRWSTWDAARAGVPPRPDLPAVIQERAWSSPIWVEPMTTNQGEL